ncbi:MAG: ThuA domain-containing protein [Flavobacteriales bacterium]|nr:ThuA domain-containing protein [Flavobacteriales bacterium]
MRNTISLLCVAAALSVNAQRVLHFTATSGYDHGTRDASFAMFTSIGNELGIEVVNDATGTTFSDATVLAGFDAIIFSNTSGNNILDATQRANFEAWVSAGGHVLGIHAASDTYRHNTANGNNTGTWDYFAELIGASVQEDPNHVDGTPTYTMQRVGAHPATYNVPDEWEKAEEYYYWENGFFAELNTPMLIVEETVGPNGEVNSYDAPRPMSWYRTPGNSRVVYTALGHAASNFTDDLIFRAHVRDALAWMLEGTTGMDEQDAMEAFLFPNPSTDQVQLHARGTGPNSVVSVIDVGGRTVIREPLTTERMTLFIAMLQAGCYTVVLDNGTRAPLMIVH